MFQLHILVPGAKGIRTKIASGDPNGSRTRVAGMKARCPRPLDDGAVRAVRTLKIIR